MKNIFKVFIIAAGMVLLFNMNSFALVDGAVWGGYVFKGEVENESDADPTGGHYGIKAHYNTSLIALFDIGIGGYYQYEQLKYDILDKDTYTRQTAGLDVNLILKLPVVHPYLRGTYAIWDKYGTDNDTDKENFKAYGAGAGLEITILPLIRIFGEYMFEHTEHYDLYLRTNAVNLGVKVDI